MIETHLNVVGHLSTFTHRAFGFSISNVHLDKYSYIATLVNKQDDIIHTIAVMDIGGKGEWFVVTTILSPQDQIKSVSINYSDFFKDLKLPTDAKALDDYLINHNKEWNKAFYATLTNDLCTERKQPNFRNEEMKVLFDDTIVPSITNQDRTKEISNRQNEIINSLFGYMPTLKPLKPASSSRLPPEAIPKFDDEYEVSKPLSQMTDPHCIPSIGDSDRDPFAGHYPEMKPYLDPSFKTPSGMIPAKNHPIFQNPQVGRGGGAHQVGPPGSRYDSPFGNDIDDEGIGMGIPKGALIGGFSSPSGGNSRNQDPGRFGGFPGSGFPGSGRFI